MADTNGTRNGNGKPAQKTWAEERTIGFTREQWDEWRERLNRRLELMNLHEQERESANGKLRDDRAELDLLHSECRSGGAKAMVTVTERPIFERNAVEIVAVDTGEVVRERAMTAAEREKLMQPELPITDASAAEARPGPRSEAGSAALADAPWRP